MDAERLNLLTLEIAMQIGGPMLAAGMTPESVIKAAKALLTGLDITADK